jgi:glycosyltransferase involved in cell wall biosynthesis
MLARYLVEAGLALLTTQGVVCSASEGAKLRRLLPFPPSRLSVINNSLELAPPRASSTVRQEPSLFSILSVGRLSHQKNPEALVRIASALHRLTPELDFRFRLIGDGPKRAAVEHLATTLKLGHRVEFLGAVRAGDWLGQADVLLSASRGEGMPLSLLEAMAAGLPIVASCVVGNVDLVQQGETGFLFPPGDLEGAAAVLARLANDQQLRHRLGANACERVRREFRTDRFAASYSAIYRELASRQAHRMEESPAP